MSQFLPEGGLLAPGGASLEAVAIASSLLRPVIGAVGRAGVDSAVQRGRIGGRVHRYIKLAKRLVASSST
jgi:hypothetical protein